MTAFAGHEMQNIMMQASGKSMLTRMHRDVWTLRAPLAFAHALPVIYEHYAKNGINGIMNHPFMFESSEWPEQPSSQSQLSEEVQILFRMARGITYVGDAWIDNTMSIIRNPASALCSKDRAQDGKSYPPLIQDARCISRTLALDKETADVRKGSSYPEFCLYNPVSLMPAAKKEIFDLIGDGNVSTIVVPSKQTWQDVDPWLALFPEATILCSGNVPARFMRKHREHLNRKLDQIRSELLHNDDNDLCSRGEPCRETDDASMSTRRGTSVKSYAGSSLRIKAPKNYNDDNLIDGGSLDDIADFIQIIPGGGLHLFPGTDLYPIAGDEVVGEFVMHHKVSGCLSCTDLYHGPLLDTDPLNNWMGRLWWKLQRQGNYKDLVCLPHFRRHSLERQNSRDHEFGTQSAFASVQEAVDILTRGLDIDYILPAHGTPPCLEDPVGCLRGMYRLEQVSS